MATLLNTSPSSDENIPAGSNAQIARQPILTQPGYDGLHRAEYRGPAGLKQLVLSQSDYERFRAFTLENMGLDFPEEKRSILARGLAEVMQVTGCADLNQLYAVLRTSSSTSPMWDHLTSALTVGETYFFRNANHFDALVRHILPELLLQREHLNRRIRIWCAGCATGEEPYSVAIALRELIPQIESWNILILATDINRTALRKAREGLYGAWSFRGVEKRIQDTYFRSTDDKTFAIADEIKRMVTFEYLNLVADPFPSLTNNTNAMELILCRNVTIYFTASVTQKVIQDFSNCLVDGGWLIPGPSEPNMVFYQHLSSKNFPGAVVYQKPVMPPVKIKPVFASTAAPSMAPRTPPVPAPLPKEPPKPTASPSVDAFQAAADLLHQGRMEEALVKLYQKLDQNPHFAPTYWMLGKIYANKGNLEEAQHWCEQAIKEDKLHPEPYYTLSMIYQQHGLLDMALDMLKKTIYLDRNFVLAHYNLAQIYQQQGEQGLARKSLQNAQQLLSGKPKNDLVPEGDGLIVERLLQLVANQLAQEA